MSILEAFEVNRPNEQKCYKKDLKNKMLLWHGSRVSNFVGILSQGLRIAPPEAPCSGYAFGKGIYLADMASKSLNYCCPSNNEGLILLCEAALGEIQEFYSFNYDAKTTTLKNKKHTAKGCAVREPKHATKIGDVIVPSGPMQDRKINVSFVINFSPISRIMNISCTILTKLG
jgi:poly [ADP-ribose] polymerase